MGSFVVLTLEKRSADDDPLAADEEACEWAPGDLELGYSECGERREAI